MPSWLEEAIITHCAPTLAGHKCGSLFSCGELGEACAEADAVLKERGVRVVLLNECGGRRLVYVFRPSMLKMKLTQPIIQAFLKSFGYQAFSVEECLRILSRRIRSGAAFPHEIGVFLDYPLEDVKAFIRNQGENCRCAGCWKAYTNEAEALKRFALYRKCRAVYLDCYRRGFGVLRLTVAA